VGRRIAIAGAWLVCLAALVSAGHAAGPRPTQMPFGATLRARLTESRHVETTEAGAGCTVKTTLDTSVSVALRTVKPTLVSLRGHANGVSWLCPALPHTPPPPPPAAA